MEAPKYFIFDLDGTLALSEHIKMLATQVACEELGITPITEEEYYSWAGMALDKVLGNLLEARGKASEPKLLEQLMAKRRKLYKERLHMVEEHEPVVGLLRALSPHYQTGLATTSSRVSGQAVLEQLGIADLFTVTVFGDDVKRHKPDPECYRLVAERLGAKPQECLIFEDSESGIAAAEAFGARVVKVTI